jgi:hypothetical protein
VLIFQGTWATMGVQIWGIRVVGPHNYSTNLLLWYTSGTHQKDSTLQIVLTSSITVDMFE